MRIRKIAGILFDVVRYSMKIIENPPTEMKWQTLFFHQKKEEDGKGFNLVNLGKKKQLEIVR